MRFLRFGCIYVACAGAIAACAKDAVDSGGDAGEDGPYKYDGSIYDSGGNDGGGFPDIPFVPYDAGDFDSTFTTPDACALLGQPCNPSGGFPPPCNPFPPFFVVCEDVYYDAGSIDAGPDAGPEAGGPIKGICLAAFPAQEKCGGGSHCNADAGQRCYVGSDRCLSPQEVACVCTNPATAGACGPP
jgi:hypothetical protein